MQTEENNDYSTEIHEYGGRVCLAFASVSFQGKHTYTDLYK
jgi:hypothetical protein